MRPSFFIPLSIIALALSAGSPARAADSAAKRFTVPFELYKGHIYISAFVNGKGPYRFIFDTGASGWAVPIGASSQSSAFKPFGRCKTATGSTPRR